MLLIDSLYVNESGGLELLKYLVESVEDDVKLEAYYLFDSRSASNFVNIPIARKKILKANLWNRYFFYRRFNRKFTKVLCFGNIPPVHKIDANVYTYFHNINLLALPKSFTFKIKLFSILKNKIIKVLKGNTNLWLVQTNNTKNELEKAFLEKKSKILILPFYKIDSSKVQMNLERNDYIYVSNFVKEKNHVSLIRAWRILYESGYNLTLHITLSTMSKELEILLNESINKGIQIINHGFVSKDIIDELYSLSKATIYPSINESLGLGIVEALHSGCDLIGADLPYIYSISEPSAVFNPYDILSIVEAVKVYESGKCDKSKLLINNEINELLKILS